MPYDDVVGPDDDEEQGEEPQPEAGESRPGLAGFVGGLLVGALIGAGVALLVAPASGRSLRRQLAKRLRHAQEGVRGEWDDLKEAARRRLARRRRLRRADRAER
jgi:hypothetical protein